MCVATHGPLTASQPETLPSAMLLGVDARYVCPQVQRREQILLSDQQAHVVNDLEEVTVVGITLRAAYSHPVYWPVQEEVVALVGDGMGYQRGFGDG